MSDTAKALALDNDGNVYVTGESWGRTGSDYATIRYDTNGNERWVARYDGPEHGINQATALAVDADGNVYVTGASQRGQITDYATIKYSQK